MIDISTLDPTVALGIGVTIGVWMPDRYSNECVRSVGQFFATALTGSSDDSGLTPVNRTDSTEEAAGDDDSVLPEDVPDDITTADEFIEWLDEQREADVDGAVDAAPEES